MKPSLMWALAWPNSNGNTMRGLCPRWDAQAVMATRWNMSIKRHSPPAGRFVQEWTEARRQLADLYNTLLADSEIVTPAEIEDARSVYHLYVVRLRNDARDSVCRELLRRGIAVGIHYPIALPNLKAYSHLSEQERVCPHATAAAQEILSLPLYPELNKADIQYIAEALKESYAARSEQATVS